MRSFLIADKRIFRWFLALAVFQALHSAEEIATRLNDRFPIVTTAVHDFFGIFPVMSMSTRTFISLNVAITLFLVVLGVFVYRRRRWAFWIAAIAALVEIVNGFLHLSAAAYTGGYFPGSITALGLLVAGFYLWRSIRLQTAG